MTLVMSPKGIFPRLPYQSQFFWLILTSRPNDTQEMFLKTVYDCRHIYDMFVKINDGSDPRQRNRGRVCHFYPRLSRARIDI